MKKRALSLLMAVIMDGDDRIGFAIIDRSGTVTTTSLRLNPVTVRNGAFRISQITDNTATASSSRNHTDVETICDSCACCGRST